jgi:DNA-binding NarL/FixJ family response regulator
VAKTVSAKHVRPALQKGRGLTKRECEVLKLLSEGLHYKEIAQSMNISTETVRHYVKSIYRKLGVTSRTHAAVAYINANAIRKK